MEEGWQDTCPSPYQWKDKQQNSFHLLKDHKVVQDTGKCFEVLVVLKSLVLTIVVNTQLTRNLLMQVHIKAIPYSKETSFGKE